MSKVIITGANSQLAQTFKKVVEYNNKKFFFLSKGELDITNYNNIEKIIKKIKPKYILNTAAYTNVEASEYNNKNAIAVNSYGAFNLAKIAKIENINLLHISSNYVFDGLKKIPYLFKDKTNPINEYGKSKFLGEKLINNKIKTNCLVLRVSWLYSEFPNNFIQKILKKISNNVNLDMAYDLKSNPTSSLNLCFFIKKIIESNIDLSKQNLTLHFCDSGMAITPYDFAIYVLKIFNQKRSSKSKINRISIEKFNSNVKRPINSSLNIKKSLFLFNYQSLHWEKEVKRIILNSIL